jgi:hypothetical protein
MVVAENSNSALAAKRTPTNSAGNGVLAAGAHDHSAGAAWRYIAHRKASTDTSAIGERYTNLRVGTRRPDRASRCFRTGFVRSSRLDITTRVIIAPAGSLHQSASETVSKHQK